MGGEKHTQSGSNDPDKRLSFNPPNNVQVQPLAPQHAASAARLHIMGQPGTFLSALGAEVLQVIYERLPLSDAGFGFVAENTANENTSVELSCAPIGFVSATTSVSALFADTATRSGGRLVLPMLKRFLRRPSLAWRSLQTVAYPLKVRHPKQEAPNRDGVNQPQVAELLSIMVDEAYRGQGVGALLLEALFAECRSRAIAHIDVTVDSANEGARRFYVRHGFEENLTMTLYGRVMLLYTVRL